MCELLHFCVVEYWYVIWFVVLRLSRYVCGPESNLTTAFGRIFTPFHMSSIYGPYGKYPDL